MVLLVGGTQLNVENAYAERNGSIITLFIAVNYAEMEYADLKALFKNNTEDIIKISDDGTEESFTVDFVYSKITDDDVNEIYTVTMITDENAFQLGRNRKLEKDNASLNATVEAKEKSIADLMEKVERLKNKASFVDIDYEEFVRVMQEGVNDYE